MIKLDYKNSKPLHEQISSGLKELIMCGAMTADEQLPSVRDLSVELTVNPNTVQKALQELEDEGIIYSRATAGRFVTADPEKLKSARDVAAKKLVKDFLSSAKALSLSAEECIKMIEEEAK